MPGFDGYEWRVMTIDVTSPSETDSVKQQYFFTSNYYNIKLHEDSYALDGDGVQHFRGEMNGAYIDYNLWYRMENSSFEGFRLVITAQVPTGFDGLVVGLMNAGLADTAEDSYLYQFYSDPQDFALFRMK